MKITKEAIIETFKRKSWEPKSGHMGTLWEDGKCCAIPVIICMKDDNELEGKNGDELYQLATEIAGVSSSNVIFVAFDKGLVAKLYNFNKENLKEYYCRNSRDKEVFDAVWDAAVELSK